MVRDLHMGRPGRPRKYDDGGLVDINGAPAEVLSAFPGIDPAAAARLVGTRVQYASGSSIAEVVAYVDLSERDEALLRDRGLILPS